MRPGVTVVDQITHKRITINTSHIVSVKEKMSESIRKRYVLETSGGKEVELDRTDYERVGNLLTSGHPVVDNIPPTKIQHRAG